MKKTRKWHVITKVAVATFALALVATLTGCPDPTNGGQTNVVTGVTIAVDTDNPGIAGAGAGGQLNFVITVQGSNVFPIDLQGQHVEVLGANLQPLTGITARPGTVDAAGQPFALSLNVNRETAMNYTMVVRVHGVVSNTFPVPVTAPPALTGTVGIDGVTELGQTLTAYLGGLAGTTEPRFQWERSAAAGGFVGIYGETGQTLVLTAADVGHQVRVVVGRAGFGNTVPSSPSLVITEPGELGALSGVVTIDNAADAAFGVELAANVAGLLPATATSPNFQWQRRLGTAAAEAPFDTIEGATGSTHTVVADDLGHVVRVVVTHAGFSGSVASDPTGTIPFVTVGGQIQALLAAPVASATVYVFNNEDIAPQVLNFTQPITITLTSAVPDVVLQLDGQGAMFTVPSGVTLILDDVELRGIAGNDSALVVVQTDGTLTMNAGTLITGNTNTSSTFAVIGGGVANSGTFNMHGGTVTANTGMIGGGVSNMGTFNMYGGTISANTGTNSGGGVASIGGGAFVMHTGATVHNNNSPRGGGVLASIGGTFTMQGGTISGNTATAAAGDGGAGVLVIAATGGQTFNSIFHMHGGAITGNTTTAWGGGVASLEGGSFHMFGGTISGNTAGNGGGVLTQGLGGANWFAMRSPGGRIYGNTATGGPGWGGGVMNLEGIFLMSDGFIYGTNADLGLRNEANDSVALSNANVGNADPVSMRGTFAVDGANINFAPLANLPSSNFTLHVENGLLASPISATGLTVQGIDPALQGTEGRVFLFQAGEWSLLTGSETPIDGAEATFTWPAWNVPLASWNVRLGFFDTTTGENVENYSATIPFTVPGITTVPFGLFNPLVITPPTLVTSITVTGIPAAYQGRNGEVDLFEAVGDNFVLIDMMVSIGPSVTFTPRDSLEPGNRELVMPFFFPPWHPEGDDVPYAIYTATVNLVAGANTIPFADFDRLNGDTPPPPPPPGPITSVTVTGVGAYIGTEVELQLWASAGGAPAAWHIIAIEEVTGDSVLLPIDGLPSGNWPIRLVFWEFTGTDPNNPAHWTMVGAYLANPKTLVAGANTVALGDFDDITPTGAAANMAPLGGTLERRVLPTERPTPRFDGGAQQRTQPGTRERLIPRSDRPAPRVDEPALTLFESFGAPSFGRGVDLRHLRFVPQDHSRPVQLMQQEPHLQRVR